MSRGALLVFALIGAAAWAASAKAQESPIQFDRPAKVGDKSIHEVKQSETSSEKTVRLGSGDSKALRDVGDSSKTPAGFRRGAEPEVGFR